MKERRPHTAVTIGGQLVVICDDGSVWYTSELEENRGWTEHRPVPGTEADAEDKN